MPVKQLPQVAKADLVELTRVSALCSILSMACFANEAELETFLVKLDPDYGLYASACGRMASGKQINLQMLTRKTW